MTKKGGLTDLGVILGVIGGLILIIFGILRIASEFVEDLADLLFFDYNVITADNAENVLYAGIIEIIIGVIVLWAWREKKVSGNILVWGIVYIILGLIGGSLGGLLIILGGILLVLDYFL